MVRLAQAESQTQQVCLSTVCRSNVERLMTLSTSAVAVCCCSDSSQFAEQPRVLDGDDGLSGEIGYEFDLVTCEWAAPLSASEL